jgi:hypothetical protein
MTITSFYLVFRFVDRDMMMRFNIGLAVGHTYAHGQASFGIGERATNGTCGPRMDDIDELDSSLPAHVVATGSDSDNSSIDDDLDADLTDNDENDETFLAMTEMYGIV